MGSSSISSGLNTSSDFDTGLDEAGLGPILGPLVLGATQGELPSFEEGAPLYNILPTTDSKKLCSGAHKLLKLERSVLTYARLLGLPLPCTAKEFLIRFSPSYEKMRQGPWHDKLSFKLPVRAEESALPSKKVQQFLNNGHYSLKSVTLLLAPVKEYNALYRPLGNKSTLLESLYVSLFTALPQTPERALFDKWGGRKFYTSAVQKLCGNRAKHVEITKEEPRMSCYNADGKKLAFSWHAEELSPLVAISSMFSKYARELVMLAFNEYWKQEGFTGLSTSGYAQDGNRFLRELLEQGLIQHLWPSCRRIA